MANSMGELSGDAERSIHLGRWLAAFVAIGLLLRLVRYAMGLPLWGDEGFISVNIAERSYRGLLQPMEYYQVAPLGFLWAQRAVYQCLGMSEYAMRLLPTLAGVAAMLVFAYWARLLASPLAATIATGIWAVSELIIKHVVEIKPYSIDSLMSLLLLLAATLFLLRGQNRWLVVLMVLTPVALFVSFAAILVAGGVALTLVLSLRRMRAGSRWLVGLYCCVLAATFLPLLWYVVARQYPNVATSKLADWDSGFPPLGPLKFIVWFVRVHTGNMFGYPINASDGWAVGSFALVVVGAVHWIRSGRRTEACLLLSPFVTTFIAAALRRYPYGASARVQQHLVPPMCLLMGVGSAALVERLTTTWRRRRETIYAIFGLLGIIALCGLVGVLWFPSRTVPGDRRSRQLVREVLDEAGPAGRVMVMESASDTPVVIRWYLLAPGHDIEWDARRRELWRHAVDPVWIMTDENRPDGQRVLEEGLGRPCARHTRIHYGVQKSDDYDLYVFGPASSASVTR